MNKATLKTLYLRDLERLVFEINAYKDHSNLWIADRQVNNSSGNLCLHICGNLQHFIGAVIGESGYIRNREDEFGLKNVSIDLLVQEVEYAKKAVTLGFEKYNESQGEETYPIEVFGKPMTYEYFLLHLLGHLNYHLGQISYHRRLTES